MLKHSGEALPDNKLLKAYVAFDHNMPYLDLCDNNQCLQRKKEFLCKHRLEFPSEVFYFHSPAFKGLSDFKVLKVFCKNIVKAKRKEKFDRNCIFVLVTKDENFCLHAKTECQKRLVKTKYFAKWQFDINQVNIQWSNLSIRIHILLLDCNGYEKGRRGNLKCAIHRIKKVFYFYN